MAGDASKLYRVSPAGRRRLQWKAARTSFLITLVMMGIAGTLAFRAQEPVPQRTLGWILIYLLCVLIGGAWLNIRSAARAWALYVLELGADQLRRTQQGGPEVILARAGIAAIEELPGQGLLVRSADEKNFVFIPAEISEFGELREHLQAWAPIRVVRRAEAARRKWLGLGAAFGVSGWLIATMLSHAWLVVLPSSFFLSVLLLWSFVEAQRSEGLDRRTKRMTWITLLPVLGLMIKSAQTLAGFTIPR